MSTKEYHRFSLTFFTFEEKGLKNLEDGMNPADIGEKIISLAKDKRLQEGIIQKGAVRLKDFGTAKGRTKAYLDILESIVLRSGSEHQG